MEKEKILVALSGGVDSAVAAASLVEQGHDVSAAYMKNWVNEENLPGECPWERDASDAESVAAKLGIPFRVVDLVQEYKNRIVLYLLNGYEDGLTPNPDVLCNREMKFGVFLEAARAAGFRAVATGHYARRVAAPNGGWDILEGLDPNKDQSYFLSLLRQDQAAAARFPVGHLPKPEVRALARRYDLPVAEKKDSQGICFIGKVKMGDFLEAYVPEKPGNIIDLEGRVLGVHRGLHFFTIGQRKGIRVASPFEGRAYVVVEKRHATRELVIGFDDPATPGLYAQGAWLAGMSFVNRPIARPSNLLARPRYRAPKVEVRVTPHEGGGMAVWFAEPQRALAAGQICALYDGETLLGGGFFQTIYHEAGPVLPPGN
ncbi:MAG: tRNA 2-thiouridine(34) synthase MnmA [Candidatus Methylacidiphilales bacterium]|nr:tRNA 2-thiouridine(34) synthase MnmA [Candidatus Methylacidiphilales bacterium]